MAMMDIEMKAEKIMQLEEENGNLKRMLEDTFHETKKDVKD